MTGRRESQRSWGMAGGVRREDTIKARRAPGGEEECPLPPHGVTLISRGSGKQEAKTQSSLTLQGWGSSSPLGKGQ